MDFSNLTDHGGFMPMGAGVITVGIVTVIFSMVGAEIATIAAAESADPEKAVAKAANSVILRILLFYVGSVFLLVTILPWNDEELGASPFVAAFTEMGIPYADHIMNAVVLTAVFELPEFRDVHGLSHPVRPRRTPRSAAAAGPGHTPRCACERDPGFLGRRILCVIAAAFSPDTIFAFLLNSSGAIILFVYLLISISQIVLRYRADDADLKVKMWLFPVLSLLTTVAMLAILVQMYLDDALRSQLLLSLLSWAVVLVLFFANRWFVKRRPGLGAAALGEKPHRVLVMANQNVHIRQLLDELRRIGADTAATYFVVVPASPIDTGAAATHGPLDVTGGDPRSRAGAAGPGRWQYCAPRTSKPTARWGIIGRCGRSLMPSNRLNRIKL